MSGGKYPANIDGRQCCTSIQYEARYTDSMKMGENMRN